MYIHIHTYIHTYMHTYIHIYIYIYEDRNDDECEFKLSGSDDSYTRAAQ